MLKTLLVECKKAHRRHDLLVCLLAPIVLGLWAGGLQRPSAEELKNGYSSLFYSIPIIHTMVLPVLMAVLASRLWDMETRGSTLKLLYTMQNRRTFFLGKVLFGLLEILAMVILEMGVVVLIGKFHGYTESFPREQFFYLIACTMIVAVMLFFSELLLMVVAANPLPALCVGIVGALLGIFSAFMPQIVCYFVPWGYLIPLSSYEVAEWNQETRLVLYGVRAHNWGLFAFTAALAVLLFGIAWRIVQKKEV